MRKWLVVALVLAIAPMSFPKVLGVFPEVMKPTSIAIGEDRLYVSQDASIFIYNFSDLKFIKKFGKRGEGPSEFPGGPMNVPVTVQIEKDQILCNSIHRISYFTKDGDFIKMIKSKGGGLFSFGFQPVGERFVGMGVMMDEGTSYRTIDLFDGDLNKIKSLAKVKLVQGQAGKIRPFDESLSVATDGDKIFLASQQEFKIFLLDTDANIKTTMQVDDYERIKCTDSFKEKYFEAVKANPASRPYVDIIKQRTEFPDYFPAISGLFVSNNQVYATTWRMEGDKVEFYQFDTSGAFKKKFLVTFQYSSPMSPYPVAFKDGKMYQVVENDDEEWELHVTPLP